MGNQDNWTTPKQIKIERAGEPRPLRRGPLKKKDRKKGKKARWDEVLAAFKDRQLYQRWLEEELMRHHTHGYNMIERYKRYAAEARIKHASLQKAYNEDYGSRGE